MKTFLLSTALTALATASFAQDLPQADNDAFVRAMPAAGLEYSYPIAVNSIIGQQIFEPVAQIIARPSEQESAYVANDDAQSLRGSCGFSFGNGCSGGDSDANLFSTAKVKKARNPMEVI